MSTRTAVLCQDMMIVLLSLRRHVIGTKSAAWEGTMPISSSARAEEILVEGNGLHYLFHDILISFCTH